MNRKDSIRAAFSRAAGTYDARGSVQRWTSRELARLIAESQAAGPQDLAETHLLEIGCGTGGLTSELRRLFPTARLTALDFSEAMLAVAKAKEHDWSAASSRPVDWRLADGEAFEPPGDERYHLIASSAAMQWFDDLPRAIQRLHGYLTPGGRLAFAVFGHGTFGELQDVWRQAGPADKPVAASGFLTSDDVAELVRPLFSEVRIHTAAPTHTFASLHELLVHCRATGVGGNARSGGLLSPAAIRRVESLYLETYSEIRATYEVTFVIATNAAR